MTKHVDAFGKQLEVGDEAVYVYLYASRYLHICKVTVVGETPQKVKIAFSEVRHNGEVISGTDKYTPKTGDEKAVAPHLLVKANHE
jgi:hypothetical protein